MPEVGGLALQKTVEMSTVSAGAWIADVTTRSGFNFLVRPVTPSDEAGLAEFFSNVDREDLRFRFLDSIRQVGAVQLDALVMVDHKRTENFLAIETASNRIVASAMLAADATLSIAEVAIVIHANYKRRGISWTLLDHIARFARSEGIRTLESIESRDNHQAIELERERGWSASASPGDPTLVTLRMELKQRDEDDS